MQVQKSYQVIYEQLFTCSSLSAGLSFGASSWQNELIDLSWLRHSQISSKWFLIVDLHVLIYRICGESTPTAFCKIEHFIQLLWVILQMNWLYSWFVRACPSAPVIFWAILILFPSMLSAIRSMDLFFSDCYPFCFLSFSCQCYALLVSQQHFFWLGADWQLSNFRSPAQIEFSAPIILSLNDGTFPRIVWQYLEIIWSSLSIFFLSSSVHPLLCSLQSFLGLWN